MRTALIIVISMKAKDDLSCADYRFTFLWGQVLKSFPTLSVVLNDLHLFFLIKKLKIESIFLNMCTVMERESS